MLYTFPKAQEVVIHVEKLIKSCQTYEQKKQCVDYAQSYLNKYYKIKSLDEAKNIENYLKVLKRYV